MSFLNNIKVLDFTQGIAGPYCTKLLSDWGAEVLKVEQPEAGDAARGWAPTTALADGSELSLLFLYLNGNKRSITLDLKSPKSKEIIAGLLSWADIVVENFVPSTADSLGVTYEAFSAQKPGLIMASITNFGRTGPYRDMQGTELVSYALSGIMYHIGDYAREPIIHGAPEAEYLAGLNAANGIMQALTYRDSTGEGQQVDVSITESLSLMLMVNEAANYAYSGGVMRRTPKEAVGINSLVECADGFVVPILAGGEWEMIAHILDAPELLDPKFADAAGRARFAPELAAIVGERVADKNRFDVFHSGQAAGMAFGVVQEPADLAVCPQLNFREFFAEVEHPQLGTLKVPGHPVKPSRMTPRAVGLPPELGEDNRAVYEGMLHLSLDDLVKEGVV